MLKNEHSFISQSSRVNGLFLISPRATFKTKLMVANGIVISQLCYLIQLWGGSEGYLLNSLQIIKNRAARSMAGYNCFNSTRKLLARCNWLSVPDCNYDAQANEDWAAKAYEAKDAIKLPIPNKTGNKWKHQVW